jgi:hypothetical protein
MVASALETSTINKYANSFEGFKGTASDGATKIYMPSAMCSVNYGDGDQSSAYAIQNLASTPTTIDVTFTYQVRTGGVLGNTATATITLDIPAYAKASVPGCDTLKNSVGNKNNATGNGLPASSIGSAVIESKTSGNNIVAISKVIGAGLTTATPGITSGGTTVNVPFVRYSTKCFVPTASDAVCQGASRQRTLFAVQNIGTAAATVTMNLYNQNGVIVGTFTTPSIAAGAKASINPSSATITSATNATAFAEFGYWCPAITDAQASCTIAYAGSASFTSSSPIAVITRVITMSPLGPSGDDYNGIPE